jgi:SNF2 family DNA or RNA helicase
MFSYAISNQHPALFVEMRLGKTLVALRRCAQYPPRNPKLGLRVLIMAPYSALESWVREADGWAVWRLTGSRKERIPVWKDIWLMSTQHPRMRGLIVANKESWMTIPEIGTAPWDAVIADESPFLKNPKAKVTKFFMRNFRMVPHRWIRTGTPCAEGEHEYFCQLAFCRGGAFGFRTYWDFRSHYMEPNLFQRGEWQLKPGAADHIRRTVGGTCCVIRRKDVGMERSKVYERREIELPKEVRKVYDKAEDEMELSVGENTKNTKWATTVWCWLRQICGGFADGKEIWQGKINELLDLVQGELRAEKVVVWCCYNQEVHSIEQRMKSAKIRVCSMTGEDPEICRRSKIRGFHKDFRVFILQQAVAQTGMDLSVSDTAIYFSSPPGLTSRLQTEDRILSLGKNGPLLYIDLVVKNSVDEDVMEILKRKTAMSDLSLNRALVAAMRKRKGWA